MTDGTTQTATILLADDEDCLRNLTNLVLLEQGYHVLSACDATEALNLAESHLGEVDLLLTDMRMPDMDGDELAKIFREKYPQAKVIFMTAYLQSEMENRLPGEIILPKPFCIDALCELVRTALTS